LVAGNARLELFFPVKDDAHMTTRTYQWDAADYACHSSAQFAWARELMAKLRLTGGENLLDIGCGDGKVSAEIAAMLPRGSVVAIDSSPEMIDLAVTSFPNSRFPNLSFLRMDAREIPFSERFDLVFSNSALHWVREQGLVLAGMKNCLKRNGGVLVQMAGKGNAGQLAPLFLEVISREEWRGYFQELSLPYVFHEPGEYAALLREAGLEPIRVELFPKEMKQLGKAGLAGWVRTTWLPFTEKVPENRREELVSALVDRFVERYPADEQGFLRLEMMRLEVEAKKP